MSIVRVSVWAALTEVTTDTSTSTTVISSQRSYLYTPLALLIKNSLKHDIESTL